jgi:hypothetical protein
MTEIPADEAVAEQRPKWCECGHGAAIHPDGGRCVDSRCQCRRFVEDPDGGALPGRLD